MKQQGFSQEAISYALTNAGLNYKENAVKVAEKLLSYGAGSEKIKEELTRDGDGGGFTQEEADYAVKKIQEKE